jgi:hypothetical protein
MAEKIKSEHTLQHPGYQYTPRKPSEKKRRKTKEKVDSTKSETDVDDASTPQSPAIFADGQWQSLEDGTVALDLPVKHTPSDDTLADALFTYNSTHNLPEPALGDLIQIPTSHLSASTQSIYEAAVSRAYLVKMETDIGSSHAKWYADSRVTAASSHSQI